MKKRSNGQPNVKGRWKFDRGEMSLEVELEGPRDYVEANFVEARSLIRMEISNPIIEFPVRESNTPLLVEGNGVSSVDDNRNHDSIDRLPEFYIKKSPKTKWQQLLVINYFCETNMGYEFLAASDYKKMLQQLIREGAGMQNPSDAAKDAVDKGLLCELDGPGSGKYAITHKGKIFVDTMNDKSDM